MGKRAKQMVMSVTKGSCFDRCPEQSRRACRRRRYANRPLPVATSLYRIQSRSQSDLSYQLVKARHSQDARMIARTHFSVFLFVLTFAFLSARTPAAAGANGSLLARKPHSAKIVGGQPILDISTRPYHASIEMAGVDVQICSAAIISSDWVVTSGHCVALLLPIDIQVRVGTVRRAFDGDVYEVAQVEQHPLFSFDWWTSVDYDVGVIKTATPIAFSAQVQPVALPVREAELPVGTPVTVAGWGAISADEGAVLPRTLQLASLQIQSRPTCNITEPYIGNITSRMICAGSSGQDACMGDNGGALVVSNTTYGVVSWGVGCGIIDFLSVFANLGNAEIRDFITEYTGL